MRVKFLAQGNNGSLLMGLELTTEYESFVSFAAAFDVTPCPYISLINDF